VDGPRDDDELRAMLGADRADIDEAQAAELRRQLDEVTAQHRHPLPVPPALGPGELRALLRECVNVVEPGDLLVIRVPADWTPAQLRDLEEHVNWWLASNGDHIRALLVPAEKIKVLHPATPLVTFGSPPGEIARGAVETARSRLTQIRDQVRSQHAPDTP
jgi:hypothetical protein